MLAAYMSLAVKNDSNTTLCRASAPPEQPAKPWVYVSNPIPNGKTYTLF